MTTTAISTLDPISTSEKKILRKELYYLLITLASPIIVQNLIGNSLVMIDTVMISRLGEAAVAAVGIAGRLQFIFMLLSFGFYSGAGVFIAQYNGSGQRQKIRSVMALQIAIGVSIAALFTIIGLFFGGFQALMPLIGWLLGKQFEGLITSVDHWIVFALLTLIGGKMVYDALKGGEEEGCEPETKLDIRQMIGLSFATSVDALAVGISFAFLKVQILPSVACIGVTTCLLSILGVAIGQRFGAKYQDRATLIGGIVLVFIGLRILLEHLSVFA